MPDFPDSPNILWICTDQQRYDSLGCTGNEFVETPTLDQLAAQGVRFDRAYCQSPVCSPSRASFMTGRYPRTTRTRNNGYPLPHSETVITHQLAEAGYECGLAGKLHLSPFTRYEDNPPTTTEPTRRVDDGYSTFHWSGEHSVFGEYLDWLREQGRTYDPLPYDDAGHIHIGPPAEYQQTTWCVQQAINYIRERAEARQPWLYSVNLYDPHQLFDPPESYLERYLDDLESIPLPNYQPGELEEKPERQREVLVQGQSGDVHEEARWPFIEMAEHEHRLVRAAYWAMIDLIDDQVGRIFEALEETGQRQNTIVVYMSDHGELLGDHGIYTKGSFFYEPLMRVPLIIKGPGISTGLVSDGLVELFDIAPTLLEVAGVEQPRGMQARSLVPILSGETDPSEHRSDIYAERYVDQQPAGPDADDLHTMIRTNRYKLVRSHATDEGELYDLETDPKETENRWTDSSYADVKAELLVRLADRMAETVDPLPERTGQW